MGFGDDLMATGLAGHISRLIDKPVHFGYWSEVFDHNPYMRTDGVHLPNNSPKEQRPYVFGSIDNHLIWNPNFTPLPGEVYLTPSEYRLPGDYYIIEPHVKNSYSANKDWGFAKWQRVADRLRDEKITLIQFNGPYLKGVERVETKNFREALAWTQAGQGYIGPEGGLHHAAAAFGKPGVVVFGGYIHPSVTGYEFQINLGGDWCGARSPCQHCRAALDKISVDQVVEASLKICKN